MTSGNCFKSTAMHNMALNFNNNNNNNNNNIIRVYYKVAMHFVLAYMLAIIVFPALCKTVIKILRMYNRPLLIVMAKNPLL